MVFVGRLDKLRLYRQLLSYSRELIYTDKQFYLNRVRQEFRKHQSITNEEDIHFFYTKGIEFLNKKRLL